jgi:catechol 2,3-dioxygenase-like lactoylglutathione lyase family enzyme
MLTDRRCATMLPASDLERAKKWYADMLGFKPKSEDPAGVEYQAGDGTEFWVYPSQFAGSNKATAIGFISKDLTAEMKELKSRGVTFEEYDLPELKTVDGVAELGSPEERGAWFKDSEGNILALFQSPRYS